MHRDVFLPAGTIELQVGTTNAMAGVTNIAIVGGYSGARGFVVSRSRGPNSKFSDDTVRLMG